MINSSLDYKSFIVLFTASGGISIASFATVIVASGGKTSASFSFPFSLTAGISKKISKTTRNKKEHNKVVTLARSKLNSIESKISEALINNEISHKGFMTIINDKKEL